MLSKIKQDEKLNSNIFIDKKYADASINIALDTISIGKQAIFFVSTKSSAEKLSEEISKKIKNVSLDELSYKIGNILTHPTQQCKRLEKIILRGIAFHHAGLTSKQRELIEDNFKKGNIKIICSTPTLAVGVDLPAFRAIIRDLKRYGGRWGMTDIPVLEYQQMAGRAGRPSFDKWGEAITVAKSESNKDEIYDKFINADNEDIFSKLAVEPVFRTYLLSLISSRYVNTRSEIVNFFSKTFWAYQYEDMNKLEMIMDKMLNLLLKWNFIYICNNNASNNDDSNKSNNNDDSNKSNNNDCNITNKYKKNYKNNSNKNNEFLSADNLNSLTDIKYKATELGQRVAELYLDPYTANQLIDGMKKSLSINYNLFSILHLVSNTLEMRPLLRCKVKDEELINEAIAIYENNFLIEEPNNFDFEYDDFLHSIKTSLFMLDWCDEMDEQFLLEKYSIRPGEIRAKLETADWIIYSCVELSKILSFNDLNKYLLKARFRLKNGVKEELLPLLKLKSVGRIRARKLFNNGYKNIGDLRKAEITNLVQLIGKNIANNIKQQLNEDIPEEIKISDKKRIGQMSLGKYS
jgi:helicase